MANIDERIVKMKFDSTGFANSAKSSLSLLDKIKESLNFKGSKKGIDQVSDSVSRFSTSNMTGQVDQVSASFSAMGAVAFSVLNNITDRAVNAGLNIGKSLTIQPLTDGFQEYQTNLNSVQTILANTKADGSTLDDVTASLDQLNTYSDQTIYNFSEMAKNIGTFTAAGVDLDTSVGSIKGIANVAALSGSNSEQASSAMYQLSQAIAANKVGLQDWNSVVASGMGGEIFKSSLFETGKALGTIADVPMDQTFEEWEDAGNSFRESLSDGWIDSDVLTTTLEGFTGDLDEAQLKSKGYSDEQVKNIMEMAETAKKAAQDIKTIPQLYDTLKEAVGSGWSKTWEIVFGNFEESKELLTGVGNTLQGFIEDFSASRNDMLQGWKDLGGRDDVIAGLKNAAQGLFSVLKPIKDAFREIFPPMTAKQLADASAKFREFTERLTVGSETADKIKRVFAGVFSIFSIIGKVIGGVIAVFATLFGSLSGGTGGILSIAAAIGDFLVSINEAMSGGEGFTNFLERLRSISDGVLGALSNFGQTLGRMFGFFNEEDADKVTESVDDVRDKLETAGDSAPSFGDKLSAAFEKVKEVVGNVVQYVSDTFGSLFGEMSFEDFLAPLLGILGVTGGGVLIFGLKKLYNAIKNFFKKVSGLGELTESISGSFDALSGALEALTLSVKSEAVMKIAIAVGILAVSLLILSTIKPEKLAIALGGLAGGLTLLMAALFVLSKFSGMFSLPFMAASLVLLAGAVLIMSAALKVLSTMSWSEIARGLTAMAGGLLILVGAIRLLGNAPKGLVRASIAMGLMGAAMIPLALALKIMASMSWGELARGLIAFAVSMKVLVTAMNKLPTSGMIKAGVGMILMGVAIAAIAGSLKILATMSLWEIAKSLGAFAGAMLILVTAMNYMPTSGMIKAGAALVLISSALFGIAITLRMLASMSLGELTKGLLGLAGVMVILTTAINRIDSDGILKTSLALIALGIALNIIVLAVGTMGSMDPGTIIKGLIGVAGALLIIAGALALMPKNLGWIGVQLILVGIALKSIADVMTTIGDMSWSELAKGLIGLAGGLLILAGALMLMSGTLSGSIAMTMAAVALNMLMPVIKFFSELSWGSLIKGLIGLAASLAVIGGLGYLLSGAVPAIMGLGSGILMLARAMATAATAFLTFAAGLALLSGPANSGMDVLKKLIEFIPEAMISLAKGIGSFVVELAAQASSIMDALGTLIGDFISMIVDLIVEKSPEIGEAWTAMLTTLLDVIDETIPRFIETFGNILSAIYQLIIDKAPEAGEAILAVLRVILDTITTFLPEMQAKGIEMILKLLAGLEANMDQIVDSATDVVVKFITAVSDNQDRVIDAGFKFIVSFINGLAKAIEDNDQDLIDAAERLGKAIINGIIKGIRQLGSGVWTTLKGYVSDAISGAKKQLQVNSPSKVFMRIGASIMEGFSKGVDKNGDDLADSIHNSTAKAIRSARKDAKALTKILTTDPEKDAEEKASAAEKDRKQQADDSEKKRKQTAEEADAANSQQKKINAEAVAPETPQTDAAKPKSDVDTNKDCPETTQLENCNKNYGNAVEERNELRTDLDENAPTPDNPNGDTPVVEAAESETDALKEDNEELEDAVSDRALTQKELKETLSDFVEMFKAIQGVTGDLSDGVQAVRDMFEMGTKLVRHLTFGSYMRNRLAGQQGRILGHAIATGMDDGMQEGFKTVDETTGNMVKNAVYVTEKELGFYEKDDKFAKIGMQASNSFQGAFAGMFNLDQAASFKTIKRVLGEYFDEFVDFFDDLDKGIGRITTMITAITNISTAVMTFVPGASAAFAGAGATLTAALATGMIGGFPVAAVVAAVGVALVAIVAIFAFWGDDIIAIGGKVIGFIADTIKNVVTTIAKFVGWFFGGIVSKIKSVVEEIANSDFVKSVVRLVSAISMFFGAIVGGILKLLASPLKPLFAWLASIVVHIKNIMDGAFGGVLDILLSVLKPIGTILAWLINHIADAVEDASGTITKVFDFLSFMVEGLFSVIFGLFKAIITDPIFNIMLGAIKLTVKVIVGLFTVVDNAVRFVLTAFDNITNAVKNLIDLIFNGMFGGILGFGAQLGGAIGGVAFGIINAFKNVLGIHSPSKVFSDLAEFIPAGVAEGIQKNSGAATDAANILGEDIVTSMEQTLANIEADVLGEIEFNPVVTPVVDLDSLKQGKNEIDRLLGNSAASGMAHAVDISNYTAGRNYDPDSETVGTDQGSATFIQNNYSPKALSPIEIYRNTKNQLSMSAKGAKPGDRV